MKQLSSMMAAAFRRLCVETCRYWSRPYKRWPAAFRRLCVETIAWFGQPKAGQQPPSGGCVLKHIIPARHLHYRSAAFRRLCVETIRSILTPSGGGQPPSGGCVLKLLLNWSPIGAVYSAQPPSGGCVLKPCGHFEGGFEAVSRLQAAVC